MRTLCALVVALAVTACAGDADTGSVGADSVPATEPVAVDTPAARAAPASAELRLALEQLLRGERPRNDEDAHSWFSAETANVLRSASVDDAGHATVDLADLAALIPNASSSAGSALLLDELNATVFGVAGITSVEYRIEGSCDRFWEWLQYGCQTVYR